MTARSSWSKWLRANKHDLAGLTGQDTRALTAIAACWELYAAGGNEERFCATRAVAELLGCMQPKYWPLAKELIAQAMDWSDRARIWPDVLLSLSYTNPGALHRSDEAVTALHRGQIFIRSSTGKNVPVEHAEWKAWDASGMPQPADQWIASYRKLPGGRS